MSEIQIKGFSYSTIGDERAIVCKYCQRAWRTARIEKKENREFLMQHRIDHLPDARGRLHTGAEEDPF